MLRMSGGVRARLQEPETVAGFFFKSGSRQPRHGHGLRVLATSVKRRFTGAVHEHFQ